MTGEGIALISGCEVNVGALEAASHQKASTGALDAVRAVREPFFAHGMHSESTLEPSGRTKLRQLVSQ